MLTVQPRPLLLPLQLLYVGLVLPEASQGVRNGGARQTLDPELQDPEWDIVIVRVWFHAILQSYSIL